MLPSLFPYEGSTHPVQLPKKSSLRRRQVVQVEVTSDIRNESQEIVPNKPGWFTGSI